MGWASSPEKNAQRETTITLRCAGTGSVHGFGLPVMSLKRKPAGKSELEEHFGMAHANTLIING
jgi:hypothetical protein